MTEERVYLWNRTRGKTDEEIYEVVSSLGRPATFLELIMAILPQELDPAEAKDCVIGFEISADERLYRYRVEVRDGQVNVERRDPAGADATIAVSLPDFVRLITEELGGVKAFMQGKLWVRGDPTFAYSIPRMFPFREKEAVS
jgi:putative sterol carrier protein